MADVSGDDLDGYFSIPGCGSFGLDSEAWIVLLQRDTLIGVPVRTSWYAHLFTLSPPRSRHLAPPGGA